MTYNPDALGPCGCIDYHYADCPTRSPYYPVDDWDIDDDWIKDVEDEKE